jgi:hypothetical protein
VSQNNLLVQTIKSSALDIFQTLKISADGAKSVEQQYQDTFSLMDKEAVVAEIIAMEANAIFEKATDTMGTEMPAEESLFSEWIDQYAQTVRPQLEQLRASLNEMEHETLVAAAVNKRLMQLVRQKCYSDYMVHLIAMSIYPSEESDEPVFASPVEVVEALVPETIVALGNMISQEFNTPM